MLQLFSLSTSRYGAALFTAMFPRRHDKEKGLCFPYSFLLPLPPLLPLLPSLKKHPITRLLKLLKLVRGKYNGPSTQNSVCSQLHSKLSLKLNRIKLFFLGVNSVIIKISSFLLEKLIVAQLLNKFPAFMESRSFTAIFTTANRGLYP